MGHTTTHNPNTDCRNTTTGTGSLIRSLSVGKMEGPYSARFPSSPIGETSRRASAGRRAADERSTCRRTPHRTDHEPEGIDMAGEPSFHHQPVMVDEIA